MENVESKWDQTGFKLGLDGFKKNANRSIHSKKHKHMGSNLGSKWDHFGIKFFMLFFVFFLVFLCFVCVLMICCVCLPFCSCCVCCVFVVFSRVHVSVLLMCPTLYLEDHGCICPYLPVICLILCVSLIRSPANRYHISFSFCVGSPSVSRDTCRQRTERVRFGWI